MITIKGIYKNGKIELLEIPPVKSNMCGAYYFHRR